MQTLYHTCNTKTGKRLVNSLARKLRFQILTELLFSQEWRDAPNQRLNKFKYFESLMTNHKDTDYMSYYVHSLFIWRRVVIVFAAFLLSNYPIFQTFVFQVQAVNVQIYLLAYYPYRDVQTNRLEQFNEALIYLCSILLMMLLEFEEDYYKNYVLGWIMIGFIAFNLSVNYMRAFVLMILKTRN